MNSGNTTAEHRDRYVRSLAFADIGTWDWNIRTGELYWSERIGPLFGYAPGERETTYENFLAAVHPADRQAVVSVDSSRQLARSAVEQAPRTGEALSNISGSIERVNDMSTQIASAAEEQSAVTEEINRNIVQINEMTGQTAAGARQTSAANSDQTRLAAELQSLVGRFKV